MTSQKDAYHQSTQARLETLRSRIMMLETKAAKTEADIKVRFDQKMEQIRGQYEQAKEKLDELDKGSTDSWLDLKNGADDAINALIEAVDIIARNVPARSKK